MSFEAPISSEEILAHFARQTARMVADLGELVRLETPSGEVAAVQRFVRHYGTLLEDAGLRCRELPGPAGPQLFAERAGDEPPLAFVGHADTVWPAGEVERRPPEVRNGRFYGPGVYDMKGGLYAVAAALRFLRERDLPLRRRLQVFVAADEEVGSETAHPHMKELLTPQTTALVPEPPCPDGSMKIERKGVGIYRLEVRGRESHAGAAPEAGVNAIQQLARLMLEIGEWNDPEAGITVNVGTVGGGTATNVVAGNAWCGVDVRFRSPEDGERIDRRLRSLRPLHPEAGLAVEGGVMFPPMVPDERTLRLAPIVTALAAEVGLTVGSGSSGGGSDGSYLSSLGLTVLDGLGVDGAGAHALDEHIVVDKLPRRAALIARLLLELDRRERA